MQLAKPVVVSPWPRAAGVLLHPTCLPGPHGIGDFGAGARAFVDWLAAAQCAWWQVLPLGPTGGGDSPYASGAGLAGNPWLIDVQALVDAQLLGADEVRPPRFPRHKVDFPSVIGWKRDLLHRAADRLLADRSHPWDADLYAFRAREPWVLDAALFQVLRERRAYRPWWTWEPDYRDRSARALAAVREAERAEVDRCIVLQFWFDRQWRELRRYAASKGVRVLGDVPIYVDADSCDTWCNRGLFQLDRRGKPTAVAGVPPDYFSELGQLWGNPLYDWKAMARDQYRWWVARLARALQLYDAVRIDHFRGFSACWSVPADAADARGGKWEPGPGLALFTALHKQLGALPLVAEDLGDIDQAVHDLRDAAGLPGMRILQFAFGGGAASPFLPHHHVTNSVVYSGTHDNDTTVGWWKATPNVHAHVAAYLGKPLVADVAWEFIRLAMASVAHTAVVPVQDLLDLGSEARLNTPGKANDNWTWRLEAGDLTANHAKRLAGLVQLYGRALKA
ncbi:MAG: 4-alpha-glucanotransferase [Deltaproteobacteria bacterium]|nr:4-alpha-glucanotransferase [Deltaproteobacteria bacterium]